MAEEIVESRGRGRPKGSLHKKTLAKQQGVTDSSFEDTEEPEQPNPETVPEPAESDPETEPETAPEPPVPVPKRRTRKTKPVEAAPEEKEPEETFIPKKKRAPPKPVRMDLPEPPTYLEVLKRGLDIAHHQQKAEKLAKYDCFFRIQVNDSS